MMSLESTKETPATHCLLCGREGSLCYGQMRDRLFSVPGTWSFYRCQNCRYLWLDPAPSSKEREALYTEYFTHDLEPLRQRARKPQSKIKQAVWAAHFGYPHLPVGPGARRTGKLLGLIPIVRDVAGRHISWLAGEPNGRLLEIGSGNGEYLRRMEDLGWDAQGIEPDNEAAKIARERLGVKIVAGTLEEAGLADGVFDAVVMNHVIEHVADPCALLRQCLHLLKPGGQAVILTPNLGGLGHRVFKRHWANLDPPRHLHIFGAAALQSAAEQAGFEVADLSSKVRYHFASWTWLASRRIQQTGKYDGKDLSRPLRWGGKMFYCVEETMRPVWRDVGEELFLRAIKK